MKIIADSNCKPVGWYINQPVVLRQVTRPHNARFGYQGEMRQEGVGKIKIDYR